MGLGLRACGARASARPPPVSLTPYAVTNRGRSNGTVNVAMPAPVPPPPEMPGVLGGHTPPAVPVQPLPSFLSQHGADALHPDDTRPVNPVSYFSTVHTPPERTRKRSGIEYEL